jgi:hypothetical protein
MLPCAFHSAFINSSRSSLYSFPADQDTRQGWAIPTHRGGSIIKIIIVTEQISSHVQWRRRERQP